ncbi:SRPBCC family protein [Mycobacterium sp.]|uniref:SRPBCC family protein n=1 Tax=Mycobacterium sp. TaxID=1785 RepID=UPI002BA046DB|nr:SRPBCC family protein [Mycobacterium sp.]HME48085.1 SRPBCC family protein [Mycobacterium sp.]
MTKLKCRGDRKDIQMPASEASVVIARPVAEAWDYIISADRLAVWEPAVVEAEQITQGPVAVGTRWSGKSSLLGVKFSWVGEFTEVDVNKGTAFRSIESKLVFSNATRFEEAEGGTRFTYRMESESGLGGIFGKLADPLVNMAYGRALRASLENLADILSAGH